MKIYSIKVVSQRNSVILIFGLMAIFMGGRVLFLPKEISKSLAVLLTALSMAMAYVFWQKYVTGRTEWTVDEEGLKMKWIKRFAFFNDSEINLKWDEIKKISDTCDRNYHTFKIKLTSGETIKFYHDNLTTRDDYVAFKQAVRKAFLEKNVTNNISCDL